MSDELEPGSPGEVQLLLFEIGRALYGADATQVLRISRPREDAWRLEAPVPHPAPEDDELSLAFGPATGDPGEDGGRRALVFRLEDGQEAQLRVDSIRGVVNAHLESLRRLPAVARARPYAIGYWLAGDRPILLIDLPQTRSTFAPQQ